MRFVHTFCVLFLTVIPVVGIAHSALVNSQPANGATLSTSPQTVEMTFGKPIRLTKLGMEGHTIALPPQSGFGTEFVLSMPEVPSGAHTLEWRGLSEDGHVMKGLLSFTVE